MVVQRKPVKSLDAHLSKYYAAAMETKLYVSSWFGVKASV